MQRLLLVALALSVAACNCQPRRPVMDTLKKEGEACQSDDTCETGLCDGAITAVCVRKCSSGCKTEEVCTQLTPGRFSCQPDQRRLCQTCTLDSDCPYPADKCIVVNNERVCGRDCAYDQSCPSQYLCVNARGADGQSKVQQCSPMVASCACLARGELMQPCEVANDAGVCRGVKTCDLVGNGITCSAQAPKEEVCNGVDDNCDGRVDEGGMMTTCGVGECRRTVNGCADGGMTQCVPGDAGPELCNNKDDDCDGQVDNGFPIDNDVDNCGGCGVRCMLPNATPQCIARTCEVLNCNPGFGNCDNLSPNGCEVNTNTSPMHCGGCNVNCARPGSSASCVNGMCQFVCAPGFVDLNGDPMDGCEYACTVTSMTDLPDAPNFVDANCDGIDGEVMNAIFVSPLGADSNPGTRAMPKLTVAAAVTAAVTGAKRDIYLAAGTYTGSLALSGVSGMNVAGWYDPMTWRRAQTNQTTVQGGPKALELDFANNVTVQAIRFLGGTGNPSAYGAFIKDSQGVQLQSLDIQAGNGAAGSNGAPGMPGTPGGVGGTGGKGCGDWSVAANAGNLACLVYSCGVPSPGAAGSSGCGFPGGQGGSSVSTFAAGQPGASAPGGAAGGQGVAGQIGDMTAPPQSNGQAGSSGSSGGNGQGGVGSFGANGYVAGNGLPGTPGTPGRGGGGGGGGCGGIEAVSGCFSFGSGGGGGGGGGCGGTAGQGGTGGGASIGAFLSNSQVLVLNTSVRAGLGGRGGNGGSGGGGGMGGAGGPTDYGRNSPGDEGQGNGCRGGIGGAGGSGGAGGHGGGGSGGPSFGLVRSSSSTWSQMGSSLVQPGMPAPAGGVGGMSTGNAGSPGASSPQFTF